MEVPVNTLVKLHCCQCKAYLSCGPIYLQNDEQSICGRCSTAKQSVRNKQYEALAELMKFPCKYENNGCREKLLFSSEKHPHESTCSFQPAQCILESCTWLGNQENLTEHCQTNHPGNVIKNMCDFSCDLLQSKKDTFLLAAFHILFLIQLKVCTTTKEFLLSIQYLRNSIEKSNVNFKLNINRGKCSLSKSGHVTLQNEDEPIRISFGELQVLGGQDGLLFNISLDPQNFIKNCVKMCGTSTDLTKLSNMYDSKDWYCENCAVVCWPCRYQSKGCKFIDVHIKCWKHEMYFCQFSSKCHICNKHLSHGETLQQHYSSEHKNITHKSGEVWRLPLDKMRKCCIITNDVFSAICYYKLDHLNFNLELYTPILTEHLHDFNCFVEFFDPHNKHSVHNTLELSLDTHFDWILKIKNNDLPFDCNDFDIKIIINKK